MEGSEVLFHHQTIVDSPLLTNLKSSTKHSRHLQWSEDVYSCLKNSRDGRHYIFDTVGEQQSLKPLFLHILINLPKERFFIKIKVFIGFSDKGFKEFHAKYRFLKVLKVPLGGLVQWCCVNHYHSKVNSANNALSWELIFFPNRRQTVCWPIFDVYQNADMNFFTILSW